MKKGIKYHGGSAANYGEQDEGTQKAELSRVVER